MRIAGLTGARNRRLPGRAIVPAIACAAFAARACRLDRSIHSLRSGWLFADGRGPAMATDTELQISDRVGGLPAANRDGDRRRDFVSATPVS